MIDSKKREGEDNKGKVTEKREVTSAVADCWNDRCDVIRE
jgi:hypothetical protein